MLLDEFCGLVFDASTNWRRSFDPEVKSKQLLPSAVYQKAVVHNSFRFFDCDAHFTNPSINAMVRALESSKPHMREKVFHAVIGCRRRLMPKKENAQLASLFSIEDSWRALKQRAQVSYLREAIENRNLTLFEAFLVIDANSNGSLDPAEVYGAVDFFNIPCTGPEDVVDFFEGADMDGNGAIDYPEWLALFDCDDETAGAAKEGDASGESKASKDDGAEDSAEVLKVTPKDAALLRKIIVGRRQQRKRQQREERLLEQAYQTELDRMIFQDELAAANRRMKDGSNPRPLEVDGAQTLLFSFTKKQNPLRMELKPPSSSCEFEDMEPFTEAELKEMEPPKSRSGYEMESIVPRRAWCWKTRRTLMCSLFCRRDYSYLSVDEVNKHNLKVQSIKEKKSLSTCLDVPLNAGFLLQLLPQTPAVGYDAYLEVNITKLPPEGFLLSLISFVPPEQGAGSESKRIDVFVDHEGLVGEADPDDTTKLADPEKAGKLSSDTWSMVAVCVRFGTPRPVQIFVGEKPKGSSLRKIRQELAKYETDKSSDASASESKAEASEAEEDLKYTYPDKIAVFNGGTQAQARGGKIRQVAITAVVDDASEDADIQSLFGACVLNPTILKKAVSTVAGVFLTKKGGKDVVVQIIQDATSAIHFKVTEVALADIIYNPHIGSYLRSESEPDLSGHPKATSQVLTLRDGKGKKLSKNAYALQEGDDDKKVLQVSAQGLDGLGFQPVPTEVDEMWASANGGKQFGIKQRQCYEGLHVCDLFGRVCACIRDKSQRDSFVRLTTQVDILQHLRKLVLKSVHKSMRKPLDLLIKVLVETGILEIITGNEEPIKVKTNDVVTEDAVVSDAYV